jgi:hypothetical protein
MYECLPGQSIWPILVATIFAMQRFFWHVWRPITRYRRILGVGVEIGITNLLQVWLLSPQSSAEALDLILKQSDCIKLVHTEEYRDLKAVLVSRRADLQTWRFDSLESMLHDQKLLNGLGQETYLDCTDDIVMTICSSGTTGNLSF